MSSPRLTPKQAAVMRYCVTFLVEQHELPTLQAIAEEFRFASTNAAFNHLQAIERKGYLKRNRLGNLMLAEPAMPTYRALLGRGERKAG